MAVLNVFLDGELTGQLNQDKSGNLTFTYEEAYRLSPGSTPLSLSMPLSFPQHAKRAVLPFFDGLLTDNDNARKALAARFGINAKNSFALLEHMGSDVAGALQILPPGVPSTDADTVGNMLPMRIEDVADELSLVLEEYRDGRAPQRSTGCFSLAGAQAKTALCQTPTGEWAVPTGSTPTTHILKPVTGDFRRIDVVEHLTMRAAAHLQLNVAETWLTTFGDIRTFVTRRFDRQLVNGTWHRLHQEDLCQALSYMSSKKYQREDGGPGVGEAAKLFAGLPEAADRRSTAESFYSWLVFNVLFECTDAHAKNFSLMLAGGRVSASPLYDLGTYAPYRKEGDVLLSSMKVGGEYSFSSIGAASLTKAARTLRLDAGWAAGEAERLRSGGLEAFERARNELVGSDPETTEFADHVLTSINGIDRLHFE